MMKKNCRSQRLNQRTALRLRGFIGRKFTEIGILDIIMEGRKQDEMVAESSFHEPGESRQ